MRQLNKKEKLLLLSKKSTSYFKLKEIKKKYYAMHKKILE
tara:strand:- start:343 stop:462 length:120 start_codon:yes stop_codon:yes gene_type:complete